MSFVDALADQRPLVAVFGEPVPTFGPVDLHEVTVHRDGPVVRLRFDLAEYPAQPPAKWVTGGADTVQVVLDLVGVDRLAVTGAMTNMRGPLTARQTDGGSVTAEFRSGEVSVVVTARAAVISSLSAYAISRGPAPR